MSLGVVGNYKYNTRLQNAQTGKGGEYYQ